MRPYRWIGFLAGCLGLPALSGADPVLVVWPYIQAVTDRSAAILWTTDVASTGKVRCRIEGMPEIVVAETEANWAHVIRLDGLEADTLHEYTVLDGDRPLHERPFRFRTAPSDRSRGLKLCVLGDSGADTEEQRDVADLMRGINPDIVIHTGDIDYASRIEDTLFAMYRDLLQSRPFYFARGNHDLNHDWNAIFPPPNENATGKGSIYSFDWGCAHFTCVDTNTDALAGAVGQLAFIDEDLAAAKSRGAKWLIIFCHEPPYTGGSYGRLERVAHEVIPPLADKHGVDLVLSGHDHNYQRSHPVRGEKRVDAWHNPDFVQPRGTTYLVSGGGGHLLYGRDHMADQQFTRRFVAMHHTVELEITPEKLSGRVVSIKLGVIDSFTISKTGERPELRFVRGDVTGDGGLNLSDPIRILGHLFLGEGLPCSLFADTVADVNASGSVLIDDAVYLLNHLFRGGPPPAEPFPECAPAPGFDPAECTEHGCRGK